MSLDTTGDDSITYRPPIRRVIRGLLCDYGHVWGVHEEVLIGMVVKRTDADADVVRCTVWELEADGEIRDVSTDTHPPRYKVAL